MKKLFYFWILLLFCLPKQEDSKVDTVKKINTISVIIDDQLWNSNGAIVLEINLLHLFIGLPQEELFFINQYPVKF